MVTYFLDAQKTMGLFGTMGPYPVWHEKKTLSYDGVGKVREQNGIPL